MLFYDELYTCNYPLYIIKIHKGQWLQPHVTNSQWLLSLSHISYATPLVQSLIPILMRSICPRPHGSHFYFIFKFAFIYFAKYKILNSHKCVYVLRFILALSLHIDILVDNTSEHALLSFMDG